MKRIMIQSYEKNYDKLIKYFRIQIWKELWYKVMKKNYDTKLWKELYNKSEFVNYK